MQVFLRMDSSFLDSSNLNKVECKSTSSHKGCFSSFGSNLNKVECK